MKIQAALITNNSPYAEVRAVVSNHDDPSTPCSTLRAWLIGLTFCLATSFINAFFDIRQPRIHVDASVPQLLAYPLGTFLARVLPDWGITVAGVRHSLNPGPFTRKEHMLITIMASVGRSVPYTNYIVWIQALPQFFDQPWAVSAGYQVLISLSTNFIGYGLAGLCRPFLVYPASCVWPSSLVTIALNTAFHAEGNVPVTGPRGLVWRWSRLRFFSMTCAGMFVWFWFPNSLFKALGALSWMTWISPSNKHLSFVTGVERGLGVNPLPTLDWNRFTIFNDPLSLPFFTTLNRFLGSAVSCVVILLLYYTNTYYTGYLPLNSNLPHDNRGRRYNVSAILDERGIFDGDKYQAYSPPFLSAAKVCVYTCFFALYTATMAYGCLYHWQEMATGFRGLAASVRGVFARLRKKKQATETDEEDRTRLDVHNRLMRAYPEVPEWWYTTCLVLAIALGCTGLSLYPTHTSPWVVLFGVALCLLFVLPIGIVMSTTGVEVTLNVLAEFLGGCFVSGNALAMCYFKTYGYVTCAQALHFAADLKLAHYVKVPPRHTFAAQMAPALLSTFVCVAVLQYQLRMPRVCTDDAPFRFTCPGVNTFFTAAVMWGTVGPTRMWGTGGTYTGMLLGFPLGAAVVVVFWVLGRKFPGSAALRNVHPVLLFTGGLVFAPWNLSYVWPAVPVAAFSWLYVKARHLALWSKYNYVLAAAFSTGIALSALVQFFALSLHGVEVEWWGNSVVREGCEGKDCVRLTLAEGEIFGPAPGTYN